MNGPRVLLKPPVRVRPGALLRRVESHVLGPRAEEELFRVADVLSEGRVHGTSFFGSTLVTIELARLGAAADAAQVFAAAERSVRVRLRAMRLAQADAARRFPDRRFGTAMVETRVRLDGTRILVDVDLELPFELSSAGSATDAG
jgi:hypothetical protein